MDGPLATLERLELFTFGDLVIRRGDGPPLKLATRKDEALLLYLAHSARPLPRETLAEMLWENSAATQMMANLRTSLTRLKKDLSPYLLITRETVALNPQSPYRFDFAQLSNAIEHAERALARDGAASGAAASGLQTALELYKGEFLAGFFIDSPAFENWLLTRREVYRVAVMRAYRALVQTYVERGMHTAALRQALRLLELDTLDEACHREVMRLYAYLGQPRAALAHYEACCKLLAEELGVEPERETIELHNQIREGRITPPQRLLVPQRALPAARTPFVGRVEEMARIGERILAPECRLVTLVGPGGIGKSRLALQTAHTLGERFRDGSVFVSLVSVEDPNGILYAIANEMGFVFYSAEEREEQFLHYLSQKHLLLVIDNFDHLLTGADLVSRMISSAPDVTFLVTSRERLNMQEEWLIEIGGMHVDDDALRLFEGSARRVVPTFTLAGQQDKVKAICQMVEGMPLAIELAASWVRVLSCADILLQLRDSLDMFSTSLRNVDERQKSLRALFDQSCKLLSPQEYDVFSKLAVLRGEWDLDEAHKIAGATPALLRGLIDKSLVRMGLSGRYSMHPLIRQYGWEQLAQQGLLTTVQDLHFTYYWKLTQETKNAFLSSKQDNISQDVNRALENIREAMLWGLTTGRPNKVLEMCCGAWFAWFKDGSWSEGHDWFTRALAASGADAPDRALALALAAQLSSRLRNYPTMIVEANEARTLIQPGGDPVVLMLTTIAQAFATRGYEEESALLEQCIALSHAHTSPIGLAVASFLYGDVAREHGDLEKAEALYRQTLQVSTTAGFLDLMAYAIGNLGRLALHKGDYQTAREHFERSLALAYELESRVTMADWLVRLGMTALYEGDHVQARSYLEQSLNLWQEIGNAIGIADALCCLADLAFHEGDFEQARRLVAQSLERWTTMLNETDSRRHNLLRGIAECLLVLGKLAAAQSLPHSALKAFTLAESIREEIGFHLEPRIADEMAYYTHAASVQM
jgi:predicted ATPase/DNA-binding SARP family transcriptional activator/Tfp pilus assembly protein PilF